MARLAAQRVMREHPPMLMQPAPTRAPAWNGANVHLWWLATRAGENVPHARRGRLDALLRRVLSRYVEATPRALRFGREARGRPYLVCSNPPGAVPDFNLSDTRGGTIIAVAERPRVGVDLERTDRLLPHRKLARRYFAQSEWALLETLPDEEARRNFLRLWTAKEASCKSTGTGIYGQLSRWTFDPGSESPVLHSLPDEAGEAARWHHLRLTPAPHYTVVLACDGWRPQPLGFELED